MIIGMQCITLNLQSMQQFKKNLQDLNVSLQTLENSLQTGLSTSTPPPAPIFQKQTGPKFYKAKHYEYKTPSGNILDVTFGTINVSPDINNPSYTLIMYGPLLQQKPTERTLTTILLSMQKDITTGKDIIKFYPDIANETIKNEYVIIDGNKEYAKSSLEQSIKNKLDVFNNKYTNLQKTFNQNYLNSRILGDPQATQQGSIFGTSFEDDKIYTKELIDFFDEILGDEANFYAIDNLSFYENILIPALTQYLILINNFKLRINDFMKLFGGIKGSPSLGKIITKNKFGVEELVPLNIKQEKAEKYFKEIQNPIDQAFLNLNNILNVAIKDNREKLSKQPINEIRKYYNELLYSPAITLTTPQRDITQALQQQGTGKTPRPISQYQQKTQAEQKQERRKSMIERVQADADESENENNDDGSGASDDEWSDSDDENTNY